MTLAELEPGTVFTTDEAPGERFVLVGRMDRMLAMCAHDGEPNNTAIINLAAEVQILHLPRSGSSPAAPIGGPVASRIPIGEPQDPSLGAIAAGWLMLVLCAFGTLGWTAEHGFLPMGAFGAVLTALAFWWVIRLTREAR